MMTNSSSPVKKYKCVFFDLDHTLWDYETNSQDTLFELYHGYDLPSMGVPSFDDFQMQFKKVNADLWYRYDRGLIDSEVIRRYSPGNWGPATHARPRRL